MRLIDADALRAEWLWEIGEYTANEILDSIDDMPTVTPEMSAVEYLQTIRRICKSAGSCFDCILIRLPHICNLAKAKVDKAISVVERWAQEHLEEVEE